MSSCLIDYGELFIIEECLGQEFAYGNNNQGGNSGRPPEGGGHHRTDGPRENVHNTPTRPSGPINRFGTEEPDSEED